MQDVLQKRAQAKNGACVSLFGFRCLLRTSILALLCAIGLGMSVGGCQGDPGRAAPPPQPPQSASGNSQVSDQTRFAVEGAVSAACRKLYEDMSALVPDNQVQREILERVNAERSKMGARALVLSETLSQAAQAHAADMARRKYFSHQSPEGCGMADRVAFYAPRERTTLGENIAMGQRDPRAVVAAWMASPGHRANLLNPDFEELGVGHTPAKANLNPAAAPAGSEPATATHWVQEFRGGP